MATQKQVNYLLFLLREAGYDTRFINSDYKKLGLTMKERGGTVKSFLSDLDNSRVSELIEKLKEAK